MKFGPQGSAWVSSQGSLRMTPEAVDSLNMSSKCPGLSSAQEAVEKEKLRHAAEFFQTVNQEKGASNGFDMAYDGCIRTADMQTLIGQINASQADVVIFDIEGWTDWELWQRNIARSANAMRRRRAGESLATLARRLVQDWFDGLTVPAAAVAPNTALTMWAGHAADNKGW